jgi:hypothetical protein
MDEFERLPALDIDPRIDLTKPIWEQATKLSAIDEVDEQAELILEHLKPHFTASDDPFLWLEVLRSTLTDFKALEANDELPAKRFLKIGCCSHWFRPHQARWTAAGGFAWPSGWHGISGFSYEGLPELDWEVLFEKTLTSWVPPQKYSGKDRLEIKISVPARSARHAQAAIHTLWSPPKNKVFYGFRKKDERWKLVARSDFYSEE